MNYSHAFHAGNAADVLKHAVLARCLVHLGAKPAPLFALDTHAGRGVYDLSAEEAQRTGEWREGIGRVLDAPLPPPVQGLLAPWLDVVAEGWGQALYPGSPRLVQRVLQNLGRLDDRLVLVERHPEVARALLDAVRHDPRVGVREADAWAALPGLLPPRERRGLVLIDPPYESPREFAAIRDALGIALRRWATGTYLVWYPVKARREVEHFVRAVAGQAWPKLLRVEIGLHRIERVDRLNGSGVLVANPPWRLDEELHVILRALAPVLAREGEGRYAVEWLRGEAARPVPAPARASAGRPRPS